MVSRSFLTATACLLLLAPEAMSQWSRGQGPIPYHPAGFSPAPTPPAPPPPPPSPPRIPERPVVPPPRIAVPPPPVHQAPPINPKDVTSMNIKTDVPGQSRQALQGIKVVNHFPTLDEQELNGDYVMARGTESSKFTKVSPYAIKFTSGEVLVCVRRPSRLAIITFPLGQVAITGDADVLFAEHHGIVQVFNLTGLGETVKVKFDDEPMGGKPVPAVAVLPGYEIVAAARPLARCNIKRADGFARRHFKVLQNGQLAICEFSLESVLSSSTLIADMGQKEAGAKDRRILSDMSKMAAVLNQLSGTDGYTTETSTCVAQRGQ